MSKHTLLLSPSPSSSNPSQNPKRARFSIDGLLESSSSSCATFPLSSACATLGPLKIKSEKSKKDLPPPASSSPSCSDSEDSESVTTKAKKIIENDEEDIISTSSSANTNNQNNNAPIGNWPSLGNSPKLFNVQCKLEGKELWAKFYDLSTEMIITKSGRRMFPTVKVRLENCEPDLLYYVFLDVVPVDDRRYRYVYNKSSWLTAGKAEPTPETRIYMHPDSPFPGRQLGSQIISFEKAKLTNSDVDRIGHLVLNSMHKYQPRVHVVCRDRNHPFQSNRVDLLREEYKSFQFTETQFMAVTAYQNQLITKLKIEKNPFAKGFRDPSGRSTEMELERHLERLPRFPFNGITNPAAAAAAAALMFGQFPFPFPPPSPLQQNSGPSKTTTNNNNNNDWFFANLAAAAALNNNNNNNHNPFGFGNVGNVVGPFPKFNFSPFLPTTSLPSSQTTTIEAATNNFNETEEALTNENEGEEEVEEDDDESVDIIGDIKLPTSNQKKPSTISK